MRIHTVKRGESLSAIARQYGVRSWRDLYNHPSNASFRSRHPNPNLIKPGDQIYIPDTGTTPVQAPAAGHPCFEAYTVRKGDSIDSIASRRGGQSCIIEIETANGLEGRYDIVEGQCIAIPRSFPPSIPATPSLSPLEPGQQKSRRENAKEIGHSTVTFQIGTGVELKQDEVTFLEFSFPGLRGNLVEGKASFKGIVQVGRPGTIGGTFWQTTDGITKYRKDLVTLGRDNLIKLYGGTDIGINKIKSIKDQYGNDQYRMEVSLTLGSKIGNVSLEANITGDSQGGYKFVASRKVDQDFTTPDGVLYRVRGDFSVQIRLGPDMKWVLASYATWKATKRYLLDWFRDQAERAAKIEWDETAEKTGIAITVLAAAWAVYRWLKTAVVVTEIIAQDAVAGMTGVLFIIMPPDYWDHELRRKQHLDST